MDILTDYLYTYYDEVAPEDFYRSLFPIGSFQTKISSEEDYGGSNFRKYNGIIVEITDKVKAGSKENAKPVVLRHTLTDDLEKISEVCSRDNFCLMSPISYVGKTRDSSNARELYALAFDLDGILMSDDGKRPKGLENLIYQFDVSVPQPTYIVSSGTGLHLYYVFETPVLCFESVMDQMEVLKKELTRILWHDSISSLNDAIQYEPVCQGFRVVGTITKTGERARAFETGKKVDIDYLNAFVRDEFKVKDFAYKSNLSLEKAKKLYPEWYKKRIIEKQPAKTWIFSRAVYDSWIDRIREEFTVGHRYWALWVLAVTAMKCGISQEELENDAFELSELFNAKVKNPKDIFSNDDVLAALEGYDNAWFTYPIDKMAYRSNIELKKNKRNGRKQPQHLQLARGIRQLKAGMGESVSGGGRPDKGAIVSEWQAQHPEGKKIDCERETGLSRHTVLKWWNDEAEKKMSD